MATPEPDIELHKKGLNVAMSLVLLLFSSHLSGMARRTTSYIANPNLRKVEIGIIIAPAAAAAPSHSGNCQFKVRVPKRIHDDVRHSFKARKR